jgi:Zn-dependent metalloprotease
VNRLFRFNPRLKYLVAAIALLVACGAQAATRSDLHRADVAKLNHQYQLATQGLGVAAQAQERHAEMLGLDADSRLQVLNHRQDREGTQYYRYQQTFRGLPIFGEQVVVSEREGVVRNLFGRKVSGLAAELPQNAASIGKTRALQLAKSASLGARTAAMKIERQDAHQVVFVGDDSRAHMAYVVSFFADKAGGGAPTRPFVIVDAGTGAVLKQWDGLAHADVGTGPGGNLKTGQYEYGVDLGYNDVANNAGTCTMSNANVMTVNLNGDTAGTTAYSYTCPRNTGDAVNGAFSPANDAHYFGKVIYDMYGAYLGVAPLRFQLSMRVHYGSGYQNAFWDGVTMNFGDGGSAYYPLVSLDLSAHEVSHGFTEQNSNLTYQGMSGGINEAYSDMAGEAAEFYLHGRNDFQVGAEIVKGAGAIRYMENPSADGASIEDAAKFKDGMDVHFSSGVYNKAFYLLATTSRWDTGKAFQVFARANQLYWTASSTFNQAACGVQTAASDLGLTVADVIAAFSAVDVACDAAPASLAIGPQVYSNQMAVAIANGKAAISTITVSGRGGNALASSKLSLNISDPQHGHLTVSLVAPDGSTYPLKIGGKPETTDSLIATFTLNLSGEELAGDWTLRVQDSAKNKPGTLNSWSLEF